MMALSSTDILVFDAEADGLLVSATTIWTIQVKPLGLPVWDWRYSYSYGDASMDRTLYNLLNSKVLVGHNICGYDLPLLEKLCGVKYKGEVIDTLVLSRLFYPDRPGGHSLESWGKRLGAEKGDFGEVEGFSEWHPRMVDYCKTDCIISELILNNLLKEEGLTIETIMGYSAPA